MKFIELNLLNPQSETLDTKLWVRTDQILRVMRPTPKDIRDRREIAALIFVPDAGGIGCWGVRETPESIIEQLEEKSFDS